MELRKNEAADIEKVTNDLNSTLDIVALVDKREHLRNECVTRAKANLEQVVETLKTHIKKVKETADKSPARQFGHHFVKGPSEWDRMKDIMSSLNAAKVTLSVHIQLVHVGLTVQDDNDGNSPGYKVNAKLVKEENQAVEDILGRDNGLVMYKLFHGKLKGTSTVNLTKEEFDSIPYADPEQVDGDRRPGEERPSIIVRNNKSRHVALQINNLTDPSSLMKHLKTHSMLVEGNEAEHFSTQINVPHSVQELASVMKDRQEMARLMLAAGKLPW